jgi:hypothetical protein
MPDCSGTGASVGVGTGVGVGAPTGKGVGVDVDVDVVAAAGVPVGVVVLFVPKVRFEAEVLDLKSRPVPPHPEIIEVAAESAPSRTILGTRMLRLSSEPPTKTFLEAKQASTLVISGATLRRGPKEHR